MKKSIIAVCLMALTLGANAQTSKNVIFNCVAKNMKYTAPVKQEQKQKEDETVAGCIASIASTVLSTLSGHADETVEHPEYADNVMEAIKTGIGSTYRFNTVDVAPAKGTTLNINATISTISTTSRKHVYTDGNKRTHEDLEYTAHVNGTVSLTDAKTGKVVWQTTINRDGHSGGWLGSEAGALGDAVSYIKNNIIDDLNSEFPLYATIVEKGIAKKDKQKEVYINLGDQAGVYKGLSFYVYQIQTVAGKEAKKEIGRIKVKEVMGDDISNCKVTKGAEEVKMALDAGKTLQIMSRG